MKKTILIVILYLAGCVTSYKYTKFTKIKYKAPHEWTKGDRKLTITLSTFSWLTVIANSINHIVQEAKNDNQKAEW